MLTLFCFPLDQLCAHTPSSVGPAACVLCFLDTGPQMLRFLCCVLCGDLGAKEQQLLLPFLCSMKNQFHLYFYPFTYIVINYL